MDIPANVYTIGTTELQRRTGDIIHWVRGGETIGLTSHGRLIGHIVPVDPDPTVAITHETFERLVSELVCVGRSDPNARWTGVTESERVEGNAIHMLKLILYHLDPQITALATKGERETAAEKTAIQLISPRSSLGDLIAEVLRSADAGTFGAVQQVVFEAVTAAGFDLVEAERFGLSDDQFAAVRRELDLPSS